MSTALMTETEFAQKLTDFLAETYDKAPSQATSAQLHNAVAQVIMEAVTPNWKASAEAHESARKANYLSMEFLVGRAVYNNLLCLGLTETVANALQEVGASLDDLEETGDAALGNGGLGRLAACFLDSAATMDLPLDGYGIRYRYGLFQQGFENGFQTETADDWTKNGDPWGKRCEADAVEIHFADRTVLAIPYDYPVMGYDTNNIGTLRLFQSEPVNTFDFALFNAQKYAEACEGERAAQDISRVLYPNDDTDAGKALRLRQEYFFSAAAIADLIRKHKKRFGSLDTFAEYNTIQLNDTHPVIAIPELIRVLVKTEGFSFETALETARKVFNYTNHTVMPEALEKWNAALFERYLPEVYAVLIQLNEQFLREMYAANVPEERIQSLKLLRNDTIFMANIASYVSAHINGVAAIHTQILKDSCLKDWYAVFPEKFQNKTNGITQRRWLALCNPALSALITKLLGTDAWVKDLSLLRGLETFSDDRAVLDEFMAIKHANKRLLADYVQKSEGVTLNPDAIFSIQIKRLHEYKRQLLNALSILYFYYGIKDGTIQNFTPTAFLFGAKAAPGYFRAKAIIKLIHEIGRLVNADPATKDLMQVVFVTDYRVSYAEKLVAAADISEQISTAGTEASGTGNMKLMLNGAVTLGTLDGANVEICEEAGAKNNYIFGATVEEIDGLMKGYEPRKLVSERPDFARILTALIDGTLDDNGTGMFRELYFALLDGASWHVPDHYYVLGDLDSYLKTKLAANADYNDRYGFAKKCWMNICGAGKFSSDRTIQEYAHDIWAISPVSRS